MCQLIQLDDVVQSCSKHVYVQIVCLVQQCQLCLGIIKGSSRDAYREIMADLQAQGAQGIILGCTEIALLVKPEDSQLPMFDTTRIHAEAAVEWALETA